MSAFLKHGVGMALVLGLAALFGCQSTATQPMVLRPEGVPASDGLNIERPEPIVVDAQSGFKSWSAPMEIIDTRTFEPQIQVTGPWDGPIDLVKNHLPKHHRDKTLPNLDTPPAVEIGGTERISRVTLGTSFEGISQTGWAPPDPTLAVGPNHIVETVNQSISWYNKNGGLQFSSQLGSPGNPGFFESEGALNFTFDPKCLYDHYAQRFVVLALEVYDDNTAYIDIAISDDDDPNGIWYKYRTWAVIGIDDSTFWVDYPGLGFDENAIYVTGNLFGLTGPDGWGGALFRIFDKSSMLNGGAARILDVVPDSGASVQVAQGHGASPRCFFMSRSADTAVKLWTINDPLGSPNLQHLIIGGLADSNSPSGDAPTLGGGELDTLDGRLMNVHLRDGHVYTSHGVSDNSGAVISRWYHIDTRGWPDSGSNPILVQQGEVRGEPGDYTFFPAVASDRFNNVAMVMARSSANQYASVIASARSQSDPLGVMSEPVEMSIGDWGYNGRWGDYFDTAVDPSDDETIWFVGQVARSYGWQTMISSMSIGCGADLNSDGSLDFFDVALFLSLFSEEDPAVDFNGDGEFDFFDVVQFLAIYQGGC